MTTTAAERIGQGDLLDAAAAAQAASRAAEVDLLVTVVDYCAAHPPLDDADACRVKVHQDLQGRPVTESLNGEGVPVVSALAVAQLGAVLGMGPGSVQSLVAEALELAYRLPGLYAQVRSGVVPVWQARRVAKATLGLTLAAAGFVDRHLHGPTGQVSIRSLDGLVNEAIARHDHTRLQEQARKRTDPRGFAVELSQCDLLGQVPVHGVLDLPDAIALDAAIGHAAEQLTTWGSNDSRDVRRARAAGDLARQHLAAAGQPAPTGWVVYDEESGTLTPVMSEPAGPGVGGSAADGGACGLAGQHAGVGCGPVPDVRKGARREVMLHLHITDQELLTALRGSGPGETARERPLLGRAEHAATGDLPITAETIRAWCGEVNTRIRVLPVLDLAGRIHHDSYEIPERLREQIIGRDHTCVFPGCHTPARACDLDHIDPYNHDHPDQGGPTSTENLAPLCRKHHNLKTSGRISYVMTTPGSYTWNLGTSASIIRDHRGTRTAEP